jgi:formylglycine-generating enzyme required for sulfatase activity
MRLWRRAGLVLAAVACPALARGAAPPTLTVDLGGGVRLELVLVKAASFRQGSPRTEAGRGDDETAHDVTLSRDYYIGRLPVTRGQFARFAAETSYRTEAEKGTSGGSGFDGHALVQRKEFTWRNPGFAQADDHPVVLVTYDDALAFAQWLARKAHRAVALPTEAQWERACRGGSSARFYRGASDDEARTIAWFKANAGNGTRPTGQKTPNALGLFDMSGNANEWVRDWYGPYSDAPATDPEQRRSTLSDKPRRVLRGGSWLRDVDSVRCAARYRNTPGSRNADNGFRVVASAEEDAAGAGLPATPLAPRAGPASPRPKDALTEGVGAALGALCALGGLSAIVLVFLKLIRRGGAGGVRSHIVDDGFWIYSPDATRGRPISYTAIVDSVDAPGTIPSPGSEGQFIYTGARPSNVRLGAMGAAAAAGVMAGSTLDDEYRRRRELDEEERRQRAARSSTDTGFPSAY